MHTWTLGAWTAKRRVAPARVFLEIYPNLRKMRLQIKRATRLLTKKTGLTLFLLHTKGRRN